MEIAAAPHGEERRSTGKFTQPGHVWLRCDASRTMRPHRALASFRGPSVALLWQIFTHAAARQISIFGSVGIAVEAVEPRAREWRDVRRAELAGAVGR